MKPKKLSWPQEYALRRLNTTDWITAWKLHTSSSTMIALEKMGLVERKQIVEQITGYDSTDYGWRKMSPASNQNQR